MWIDPLSQVSFLTASTGMGSFFSFSEKYLFYCRAILNHFRQIWMSQFVFIVDSHSMPHHNSRSLTGHVRPRAVTDAIEIDGLGNLRKHSESLPIIANGM